MVAWGLPGVIVIAGIFFDPLARTLMWSGALLWQGVACLVNASRCGRTHCYFTGPFFLLMALLTLLHGIHVMPLGANGWYWLGLIIVAGSAIIWFGTEKMWGKFFPVGCCPED